MNAEIDVCSVRIETGRLVLRPWSEEDLQDLYAYASVPGVGEMAGWHHHRDVEESRKILQMFIDQRKTLALELKGNGSVIGSLGIEKVHTDPEPEMQGRELGYVLSKAYWGLGLMPEAVRAVSDYCFHELCYDFLTCSHFIRNRQSQRVIEKCGFRYFRDSEFHTQDGAVKLCRDYILYNQK